ncbi:MAG TPA: glycosyltransferase family 87 protein [Bryobacteraceae bacterium]|nr:glycosyltransferase family 87 protein [Bryobacteraceae bacterium]
MEHPEDTQAAVRGPKLRQLFSWVVVAVCALYYLYSNLRLVLPAMPFPSDFSVYRAAGQAILVHQSPFHVAGYLYPPLFAFLIAPAALLSYPAAQRLWFAMSHAFFLASAYMLWRYAGRKPYALCCIAVVWAFGGAANESLALGQIGPLLLLLLVLTLPRSPEVRGLAAGAGAALKYMPALVAAPFMLARDWRALRWLAGGACMLFLIPWLILITSFPGPYAPPNANFWMGTPAILSWSLPSSLLRVAERPVHGLPASWLSGNDLANIHLPLHERILSLSGGGSLIAAGILVLIRSCRGKLGTGQLGWAVLAMTSLAVVAAPISWTHYQILNYPGAALLLIKSAERRDGKLFGASLLCFALIYQVPLLILKSKYEAVGGWAAMPPATIQLWSSVSPAAGLGLFALFIARIRMESRTNKTEIRALPASAP